MTESRLSAIAAEVFAAEVEAARIAGDLGYMARVLVQATLPHSRPASNEYERQNGHLTLSMWAPRPIGLPYGSIPRLLLAWVTTEAVRTKQRELVLGDTLSGFMRQLDLVPTGGRWGTIPRLREQMRRLFAATIACSYTSGAGVAGAKLDVATEYQLWWDPQRPAQAALWRSTVTLGEQFFKQIVERPVPIDMAALKALKRSPLALDLYVWLSYRLSYVRAPLTVPWEALHGQFGAHYAHLKHLKPEVTAALAKVGRVYPAARCDITATGLYLAPSPTHVPRRPVVPRG